jgi:hypothetical protein
MRTSIQKAVNGNEHMKRDIVKATEGRYIGGVRDTSAPTDGLFILLKAIIGMAHFRAHD